MPDLHGRISQQITKVEAAAEACPPWPWTYNADEDTVLAADGIQVAEAFALSSRQQHAIGIHIAANDPEAVLRRCAADRKILARHCVDPEALGWSSTPYFCQGCGCDPYSDYATKHINDCPELLDLAAAHGITDEELAQLDRPEPLGYEDKPQQELVARKLAAWVPACPTGQHTAHPGYSCEEADMAAAHWAEVCAQAAGVFDAQTTDVPAALRGPNWKDRP